MGLGDKNRDKRLATRFEGACLTYHEIARLWERDGLACKAIEAPSAEAFREGYEITIGKDGKFDDLKEEVEEKLEDIGADDAIELAWQYKRAYGAGIIFLGTNDPGKLDQKLDPDRVRSLDYLTVFEPLELIPEDPSEALASYGEPEYYTVNTSASTLYAGSRSTETNRLRERRAPVGTRIHASRLITFQGIKTSRYLTSGNTISHYYGTSVVNRFYDALRDAAMGFAGAGHVAIDAAQPIIKIQNLRQLVAKDEAQFRKRMEALDMSRSLARAILLDAEKEEFAMQTTNLSGFPDILDRLGIYLSANIDIPLSVLLGYSPSSLGQPGEVELKLWYNKIRALQRRKFSRVLKKFARTIMRSLRQRKLPTRFGVEWFELERLNELQRAEARLNTARHDEIYLKYGTAHPDEIRNSRWTGRYSYETQIDSSKKAPGFVAPLPGVSSEGSSGGTSKPTAGNAVAHTVTGYARRNPTKRDAMSDLEYARAKLEKARAAGAPEHVIKAHEYVVAYEEEAEKLEAMLLDEDGGGQHVTFAGMQVCIESAKGSRREWIDTDGTTGSTTMKYDYGYIVGSRGTDGDSLDAYLGPSPSAEWVYIVHQQSKASGFTEYDEDKVMLGFDSPNHARDAYLRQYDDERFFGRMTVMSLDDFRLKMFAAPGEKVTA